MGSFTISDADLTALLRASRTTTQEDIDARTAQAAPLSAEERWASIQAHSAAAPAAH